MRIPLKRLHQTLIVVASIGVAAILASVISFFLSASASPTFQDMVASANTTDEVRTFLHTYRNSSVSSERFPTVEYTAVDCSDCKDGIETHAVAQLKVTLDSRLRPIDSVLVCNPWGSNVQVQHKVIESKIVQFLNEEGCH